jgi:lipopolysaccharide/colanic/teichoic acid biosynthesis glycosyltransferase
MRRLYTPRTRASAVRASAGWRAGDDLDQVSERTAAPVPAVRTPHARVQYDVIKRAIDFLGSLIGLIILSPVMLGVAIAILADDGLPIMYRSRRVGRGWTRITVWKFRTMHDGSHHHLAELLTDDEGRRLMFESNRKLKDDPRRTRVGVFLRRSSLDELPQLWNVLRGDMSLIGPRPCAPDELRNVPEADVILSVRPGITGLWQVSGRSDLGFAKRMELDAEYVRRRGLRYDLAIMARTIDAVISGRGAY